MTYNPYDYDPVYGYATYAEFPGLPSKTTPKQRNQ